MNSLIPLRQTRLGGQLLVMFAILLGDTARAHECGPSPLKVAVGHRVYFRINADVAESQNSVYDVFLNTEPAVATIAPLHQSTKKYAEFVFQANSIGTTFATIHWAYAPTPAARDCIVQVDVVADMPMMTAVNYPNATHTADPVNLFTGELVLAEEPDLNLGGPMPLYFSRYHASGLTRDRLVLSTLGPNWSHNFDTRLVQSGSEIDVITDKGRLITFTNRSSAWQLAGSQVVPFQLMQTPTNYVMLDPQDRRFYTFNTNGQLITIADGKGNVHTLTYTDRWLTQVTDGLGRTLMFVYVSFNQLVSVSDGTRTVGYGYSLDGFGNLARVTDANSRITSYNYDNFNGGGSLLASKLMPEGNIPVSQKYDTDGRVITQIVGSTLTNRFNYQANHITVTTDPRGFTRRYAHDAQGQLLSVMDEAGRSLGYTYDAAGRLATITDRRGGVTRYTYHPPSGELASVVAADGSTNSYDYTLRTMAGLTLFDLASRRGPDGALEQYFYDAPGNRVRRVDALGQAWRYGYNGNGQVLNETNPLNAVISYTYNADGTPASLVYPGMDTTLFAYDPLRRLAREDHPDGSVRRYSYDALDRVVRMTNELGGVTGFGFDGNGRLVRETNAMGFVNTFNYNSADQLVALVDPSGRATRLLYEERGFLKGIGDRLGHTNLYGADALGDLVSFTDPLANTWRRAYAPETVPLAVTNPIGQVTRFATDALRRYTQIISPLGNTERLAYDAAGRVTESISPSGRVTQERYDRRGDLLATAHPA